MEASSVIFMGGCFRDLVACSERFPKVGETIVGKVSSTRSLFYKQRS